MFSGKAKGLGPDSRVDSGVVAQNKRWGVILAGGDGTRLRALTRYICGDDRPKQFCPLFDDGTLLEQTVRRAERSLPVRHILFALTNAHREYFAADPDRFRSQRFVQPENKGTAPPILFSVLSIEKFDDEALIAFLPSDHYYADEARFAVALESAIGIAAKHPESVVLIGAQPNRPEVEYGWIALGEPVDSQHGELYRVAGFLEKPPLDVAQRLIAGPWAWNTFVMVGHVRAFRDIIAQSLPDVLQAMLHAELWAGAETCIGESVYSQVPSSDFSRQVLSVEEAPLLVLRVPDLGWCDLGHPGGVMAVLEETSSKPRWWTNELRKGMAAAGAGASSGASRAVA